MKILWLSWKDFFLFISISYKWYRVSFPNNIIKVCIYKPIFTEKYVHKTPFETYNKALSSLIIIICEMLDPMYIHTATGTACLNNRLVQQEFTFNLPSRASFLDFYLEKVYLCFTFILPSIYFHFTLSYLHLPSAFLQPTFNLPSTFTIIIFW